MEAYIYNTTFFKYNLASDNFDLCPYAAQTE